MYALENTILDQHLILKTDSLHSHQFSVNQNEPCYFPQEIKARA